MAEPLVQRFSVAFEYAVVFTHDVFASDNTGLALALGAKEPGRRHRVLFVIDRGLAEGWPGLDSRIAAYAERSGLETEDVALAGAIVTVPINPDFGSLNLAQAVILLAYEWSKGAELAQPTVKEIEPPAPMAELEGLVGQLNQHLDESGYFFPPERTAATQATIRTILSKPQWSSRELKAMRWMLRQIANPRPPRS